MVNFVAIFNILASSQERFDRLERTLNRLPRELGIDFSVRIRGSYQGSILKTKHNIRLYSGSTWGEWNLDLLQQVVDGPATHYLLLQEDHLLQMQTEELGKLLSEISKYRIDYLPLSFHPQYEFLVKEIAGICKTNTASTLKFWNIDPDSFNSVALDVRNYPLNLVGIYTRDLLESLLLRERPIYKKYSIEAPFNFERSPSETWFLPLNWGYPNNEVFACIDDDHGIPGYSLSSRGIQAIVSQRQVNHHQQGFVFGELPSTLSSIKQIFIRILPPGLLVLPRNLKYTWGSVRGFRKRRNIQRRLLGNS